jgi:hypothetical protein
MTWNMQYQEEYQAALGRMLVRFNDLEMQVAGILEQLTIRLGVPHLYKQDDYLSQKIDRLELALCAKPHWPKPDLARLRRVNGLRNDLAHGHFHQNPNTGEYETRPVHKTGKKAAAKTIDPKTIHAYTEQVAAAQADVGRLWPRAAFGDTPAVLPPGAMPIPT